MNSTAFTPEYLGESIQVRIRTLNIVIVLVTLGFVTFRIFIRKHWGKALYADDWCIIASTVIFVVSAVVHQLMIQHGVGKHMAAVSSEDFSIVIQALFAEEFLYATTILLTKIAVLLLYVRIFPLPSVKKGALILGAITICWALGIIFSSIFECTPIEKAWIPTVEGHCFDLKPFFIGNSAPNIITDLAILALPMPQVWKLQTTRLKKLMVTIMLLLGSFVVFASVYRLFLFLTFNQQDFTWSGAEPSTWSVVETAAAIISACLPTFGPAIRWAKAKLESHLSIPESQEPRSGPFALVSIGGTADGLATVPRQGRSNFSNIEEGVDPNLEGTLFPGAQNGSGGDSKSNLSLSVRSKRSEQDDFSGDEVELYNQEKKI